MHRRKNSRGRVNPVTAWSRDGLDVDSSVPRSFPFGGVGDLPGCYPQDFVSLKSILNSIRGLASCSPMVPIGRSWITAVFAPL